MSNCGGCAKKKRVAAKRQATQAYDDYRRSVLGNFMKSRKNLVRKQTSTTD